MGSTERPGDLSSARAPEAIQPPGWLIVCDARAATVRRHSINLAGLFPAWEGAFIGASLRDLVGSELAHGLRNALSRFTGRAPPALLPARLLPGCEGAFDLTVHATEDETLIEIEKAAPEAGESLFDRLRASAARIAQASDIDKLLVAAARLAASMLLYDRVTVLRLDAGGKTFFVAEQKSHDLASWADGPCPIESIPQDTREKYLGARVRVIADARAAPTPLVAAPDAGPLELAGVYSRAPSPDERDSLHHCGFLALFATAIVVEDHLWGLILCHDRAPQHPSMDLRAAAELFGEFVSLQLQILLQRRVIEDLVAIKDSSPIKDLAARPKEAPERSLNVMIVEDQALLALDLEAALKENGIAVARICTTCDQALAALDEGGIDAAILDFNLGDAIPSRWPTSWTRAAYRSFLRPAGATPRRSRRVSPGAR